MAKAFNLDQLKKDYAKNQEESYREIQKWVFSIATLGLGALYLWTTTKVIPQGHVGLRENFRGEMALLPPGRHSNFPWERYPVAPQSLSQNLIKLGPLTIVTVKTGQTSITNKQGNLEVLEVGCYLLEEANHIHASFLSTQQETEKLGTVTASTSDNVSLTIQADVRYQITDPKIAISQIKDIKKSITELSAISISRIVSLHQLNEFTNISSSSTSLSSTVRTRNGLGFNDVVKEISDALNQQLKLIGVTLLNLGITSWKFNDHALAHELGQGSVINSQIQSKRIAAESAAATKAIETEAEANNILKLADARAQAIKLEAAALQDVITNIGNNPVGQAIYTGHQQSQMVRYANNPHLFLSATANGGFNPSVQPTINLGSR